MNSKFFSVLILVCLGLLVACTVQQAPNEITGNAVAEEPAAEEENDVVEERVRDSPLRPRDRLQSSCEIAVYEGELVQVRPQVVDADNDKLVIEYSRPLNSRGQWQTEAGDSGIYPIDITVTDGELSDSRRLCVQVFALNQPPELSFPPNGRTIVVSEGDLVRLEPKCVDPDGDTTSISYSGWMETSTAKTNYNDAGEYTVRVVCEDSYGDRDYAEVAVTVLGVNRAPRIVGLE